MNRIPVRVTPKLVLQLTHFALASLNYVIFVIITQYLITGRLNDSRDRLRTGELEWFQILGETMGSCLTSWRFLPRWITHNSLMSNKINNAICIRVMTFTVLPLRIVLKWIVCSMTHILRLLLRLLTQNEVLKISLYNITIFQYYWWMVRFLLRN